jgi:hypothetical protein
MIATASNGEVEHEDSQREDITPNVVSHWIWTIKESFYLFELSFKIGY